MQIRTLVVIGLMFMNIAWSVEGDVNIDVPLPNYELHSGRDTVEVIIGAPAASNVIPFWGASYNACRFQVLFLQSEINTTGDIIKFAFMPSSSGSPTANYYNVKVYFCHTSVTQLATTFDNNYSGNTPVEVIAKDTLLIGGPQNTWMDWDVYFSYNNTDNLLVEIKWNGDAGTSIALWRTSESVPRRLYAWDDNASSGTQQNTGNHVRLTLVTNTGIEENTLPYNQTNISLQSIPNPFIDVTAISYTVTTASDITLEIYDALGRQVKQLVHTRQIPGSYNIQWDGTDDVNRPVENGVYFCRFVNDANSIVKPIVLLKQ